MRRFHLYVRCVIIGSVVGVVLVVGGGLWRGGRCLGCGVCECVMVFGGVWWDVWGCVSLCTQKFKMTKLHNRALQFKEIANLNWDHFTTHKRSSGFKIKAHCKIVRQDKC